ncbi:MAG: aminotransferase class III-fold pyridoxal phosphate-dependent enzyme [Gammaproteobacteria bacterium]|nr:aminotransferase class III-fold pyridoxal phosphate-dependent enzyme [Gammaproteobacteria bacterium]
MDFSSQKLQSLRENYLPKAVFQLTTIAVSKAKGARVWDNEGKEYIDFVGGIGCVNAGHCPDDVVSAIQAQAEKYIQPSINVFNYQPYLELVQALCQITPGAGDKQAVLFNSGAEAVENAVKIARYATKRPAIICFDLAFHGRTLLAMSLTSKTKPYKYGYGPYAPEIYRVPHPAMVSIQDYAAYWEHIFSSYVPAEQVAAIIFEPELGEGGFIPMPGTFLEHLRTLCTERGILMVADEIQTGFCRTGKWFAMEHFNITPDLMVLGKSIASGMPLTAVVGTKQLMNASHVGGIGGTFCGNPLACVAALATLSIYKEQRLADRAVNIGNQTKAFFEGIKEKYQCIGSIRGLGAMIGIEFVDSTGKSDADLLHQVMDLALSNGVILMSSGLNGNVLRTLMPLVITDEELQRAFQGIEKAIQACLQK